jgi:hypothetical protein
MNGDNEIKPYSLKELAALYGMSMKSMRSWLLPFQDLIGKRYGRYYTVHQIEFIFTKFGYPHSLDEES